MAAQPCPLFRHFEQPRSTCTLAPVHFVFGLFLTIRVQLNRFSLVFPFPKDSSHSSSGYATKNQFILCYACAFIVYELISSSTSYREPWKALVVKDLVLRILVRHCASVNHNASSEHV